MREILVHPHQAIGDGTTLDLKGGWNEFWGAINKTGTNIHGLLTLLTVIGTLMIAAGLIGWLWKKRRGGGLRDGSDGLFWTLIAGVILAAPNLLLPILLGILDTVANAIINLFHVAG